MPPMLRLAFCTVLSDIPASAAAFTMSSLASSFPSASKSSISRSACSVLVAVFPPAPDRSSLAVMSYSPIHEKPVSGSRQKATGFPSGGFVQVSDKDNGAAGTLGNFGKSTENGAHLNSGLVVADRA